MVEAYPISFHASDFVMIGIAVTLIGFFAAWYPVRVFTKKHMNF
jgi:lipoprotein-releasing system permease protein